MIDTDRRELIALIAALGLAPARAAAAGLADLGKPQPFSWDWLQQRAAALARQPYQAPAKIAAAANLDYDAVGGIAYRADRTLAGGIRLFPVGKYAQTPIDLAIVENGQARTVNFSPDMFTSKGSAKALGISGIQVMSPDGKSNWLAFQGASYFRSAGAQDQYGLSARGLAIDTGIDGKEEFPTFTHFWIERNGPWAYTIYALLDGESVTGAYRFVSRFDHGAIQDVSAVIHLRRDVERLGIAPATSMFWYGEGNRAAATDWRPEIHDSDGLEMMTGAGEQIWRPLENPPHATLDSFQDDNPRGFGLIQRDRDFDHYQDDGAFYDRRPNLWIEPKGDWGKGAVTLFAFPTTTETVDNVVAFWVPAAPAKQGQRLAFDYRLTWNSADPLAGRTARAVACWTGTAGRPGQEPTKGARKLVIDFVGETLAGLDINSGVTAQIDVGGGRLLTNHAYPVIGQANRWRVMADIATAPPGPADIRLFLKRGAAPLSETVLTQLF
ncbi:glucan biosynthesis protein [Hephaestia mangrovi]|uniref:glucan biosynthesis protein n=1 Tax=Hephaestia mangrovi TaxID=2873268 RepID=UPI001CA7B2E7|nr:glucan biosynthesis protein D [Hephaestia mangrovi]MBY8826655.1 glucan biosynthesis protein [Hephaestia mangrovi]